MLPNINLDDEMFSEISENAKKLISKYAPSWTDINAHDPGVTFIELFAWLKELQQYRMDQIGDDNRRKFLKLLGMHRQYRKPSACYVQVTGAPEDFTLLEGTPFYADDICFEIIQPEFISSAIIQDAASIAESNTVSFGEQMAGAARNIRLYAFGKEPQAGNAFALCFDKMLPKKKTISIYFGVYDGYEVNRNPIESDFQPIVKLQWQYYTEQGWVDIETVKDDTYGFLQSGAVRLSLEKPMEKCSVIEEGYWIRAVVVSGEYDVAPVLTGISLNSIEVKQKETMAQCNDIYARSLQAIEGGSTYMMYGHKSDYYVQEAHGWRQVIPEQLEGILAGTQGQNIRVISFKEEFEPYMELGEGDGFPYQKFVLEMNGLMTSQFRLMVKNEAGLYEEWEMVDDFDCSDPSSKHFSFDEETGCVTFGDCERGLAPEGRIVIAACALTLGRNGNVKKERIRNFGDSRFIADAVNHENSAGGQDTESFDQCFKRFQRESHRIDRAVTYGDFESIVAGTQGLMINNCKAIPASKMPRPDGSIEQNCVNIVVQPYSTGKERALSPEYTENIRRLLEKKHLIGTKVNIMSPEYIGITIFAEISVKSYYRNAREEIENVVKEFFRSAAGDFGRSVQYSTIYGIIDTLDCVTEIKSLVLDAQGKGIRRSVNGDVLLPQNGMAFLKEEEFVLSASE